MNVSNDNYEISKFGYYKHILCYYFSNVLYYLSVGLFIGTFFVTLICALMQYYEGHAIWAEPFVWFVLAFSVRWLSKNINKI